MRESIGESALRSGIKDRLSLCALVERVVKFKVSDCANYKLIDEVIFTFKMCEGREERKRETN